MKTQSKFLSYVLRHNPDAGSVTVDKHGWASVDALVAGAQREFPDFTHETLEEIVRTNGKKRFEYDVSGTMIRACQGHSIPVDLGLTPLSPPDILYHGTAEANIDSITLYGIHSGTRHAVHLSEDREMALNVGSRHGTPVVLTIDAYRMYEAGHSFTKSTNGVWLVDKVPAKFILGLKKPLDN